MTAKHVLVPLLALASGALPADQVRLNAALAHPVLRADQKGTTYLKVGLTGFRFAAERERAPVNVAIVIDRSGSMTGEKIAKAKDAAGLAVSHLSSRDIVSVVAYNHDVQVILPATRLTEKEDALLSIRRLEADGNTALFAGVSKGAAEVRKFLDRGRVNRIILISDGLANVGPSSPAELGDLGASLIKEGISVTTIGLGQDFNEDLLTRLAEKADGNHYFAEKARDLDLVFRSELGDVLSVAAQEVAVKVECAEGIRPVRLLGRQGDITGQNVTVYLNQIYSEQEKYVLLEIEVPPAPDGAVRPIAAVTVTYANMQTRVTDTLRADLSARFSASPALVDASTSRDAMVSAIEQIATAANEDAVKLRDLGKIAEARALLERNARFLAESGEKYNSGKLRDYGFQQKKDADVIDKKEYFLNRKGMMERSRASASQQKPRSSAP